MNKDAKKINPSLRPQIDIVKGYILNSKNYFDGSGYVFKKAVKELRQMGFNIIYNKIKGSYLLEK